MHQSDSSFGDTTKQLYMETAKHPLSISLSPSLTVPFLIPCATRLPSTHTRSLIYLSPEFSSPQFCCAVANPSLINPATRHRTLWTRRGRSDAAWGMCVSAALRIEESRAPAACAREIVIGSSRMRPPRPAFDRSLDARSSSRHTRTPLVWFVLLSGKGRAGFGSVNLQVNSIKIVDTERLSIDGKSEFYRRHLARGEIL